MIRASSDVLFENARIVVPYGGGSHDLNMSGLGGLGRKIAYFFSFFV